VTTSSPDAPASRRPNRLLTLAALAYALLMAVYVLTGDRSTPQAQTRFALYALVALIYAGLSLVAVHRRPESLQVRLFLAAGLAITLTIVWPLPDLEMRPLGVLYPLLLATSLVYTLPVGIFIHLAALIPRPHPWLERGRWMLPAAYGLAMALGLASFALYVNALTPVLPWRWTLDQALAADGRLNYLGNLLAGVACIGLLQGAARRDPSPLGRRQAAVVMAAFVPWTFRQGRKLLVAFPQQVEHVLRMVAPFTLLIVALGFFVAIAGFQLFSLGRLMRRGVSLAISVLVLAGVGWFLLVLAGESASQLLGVRPGPWSAAMLMVGIGVALVPVWRWVGHGLDLLFFPEKPALRRLQRTIIPELAEITGLEETAEHLVRRLAEALGLRGAALVLADERRRFYRVHAVAGDTDAAAREAVARGAELDALWPAGARRPRERGAGETPEVARLLELVGARWLLPVEFRGELTAVVTLGEPRSGAEFDAGDFERLEVLAQQVSAMLENARLFGLATRDHLTGLPHRRVFEERLALELERARRHWRPFVVGLADVDDFKRVNDTLGHAGGDRVLRRVGGALAGLGRGIDVVARYGGEEFALLLPETDDEGAAAFGERLRRAVEEASAGEAPRVTVSAGLYVVRPEDLDRAPEELVRRADHALYDAKRAGKNRVELRGLRIAVQG